MTEPKKIRCAARTILDPRLSASVLPPVTWLADLETGWLAMAQVFGPAHGFNGNHPAGLVVQACANAVRACFDPEADFSDREGVVLKDSLAAAHDALEAFSHRLGLVYQGKSVVGASVLTCLFRVGMVHLIQVGDGVAYRFRTGMFSRLTQADTLSEVCTSAGIKPPYGAGHTLTRWIGFESGRSGTQDVLAEVKVHTAVVEVGDFYLFLVGGSPTVFDLDEMNAIFRSVLDLEERADALAARLIRDITNKPGGRSMVFTLVDPAA